MILIIGFGVLTLIGITLWILSAIKDWGDCCFSGVCSTIIFGMGFIVSGVIGAVENTPLSKAELRIMLDEEIASLNATYDYLIQYEKESTGMERLEIIQYNTSVSELKNEISVSQLKLHNPWINWFTNPVYGEYSVDCVSYIKL